jgi:small conductance mechanosensitive channel
MLNHRRPRFDARAPAQRARSITLHTIQRAHAAPRELLLVVPLMALTIVAYVKREELFGLDTPVRVTAAVVLVILGWALARDLGRWVAPALFRRVDPGTAGTVSFLIRLTFLAPRRSPRCGSRGWTRARSPSAVRSPRSSSASPPSRRSGT